jgi:SH3 domain protein
MRFLTALLLGFMLTTTIAFAETVYVDDNLRVGVRPEPDNSYSPISVVVSGMILEVLERKGNYMRIRTPSGVEGWVSNSYVTKKKPAQILVDEYKKKQKGLDEKIKSLNDQVDKLTADRNQLQLNVQELERENTELKDNMDENSRLESLLSGSATPWWQNLIILLFLMGLAFTGGVLWYRRHTAKKLGGLSI